MNEPTDLQERVEGRHYWTDFIKSAADSKWLRQTCTCPSPSTHDPRTQHIGKCLVAPSADLSTEGAASRSLFTHVGSTTPSCSYVVKAVPPGLLQLPQVRVSWSPLVGRLPLRFPKRPIIVDVHGSVSGDLLPPFKTVIVLPWLNMRLVGSTMRRRTVDDQGPGEVEGNGVTYRSSLRFCFRSFSRDLPIGSVWFHDRQRNTRRT